MKIKSAETQLREGILELDGSIKFMHKCIDKNKKKIRMKESAFLSMFVFKCKEDLYREIESFKEIIKDLEDYKEMLEDKLINK